MDKVQVYYTCLLSIGVVGKFIGAAINPHKRFSEFTCLQQLLWMPVGLLLVLPITGRIYGWW